MKILRLVNFLIALIFIFVTSYGLGYFLLEGALTGNDTPYALTVSKWLNESPGRQPIWFPLQNAGVSITYGTQLGAYYWIILLYKLTGLTLVQSLRLFTFLSFPLTSFGIYFFVWHKFKNQTMAAIAGVFYLLSQAVWSWLTDVGLIAQGVSLVFVPPTLLFLDLYLASVIKEERGRRPLVLLFLTSLFLGLSGFTHFTTGVVVAETVLLYAFLYGLATEEKALLKRIALTLFSALKVLVLTFLLFSFWIIPFLRYMQIAGRNGIQSMVLENLPFVDFRALFGFTSREELAPINQMWYVFFALPVGFLALVGMVSGLLKKKKEVILLSLVSLFFVFYAAMPGIFPWLVQRLLFLWSNIYVRAIIPSMVILPILAALGANFLAEAVSFGKRQFIPFSTIGVSLLAIIFLRHAPPGYTTACYWGYGVVTSGLDYCQFFGKIIHPNFKISQESFPWSKTIEEIVEKLNLHEGQRLDISPKLGHLVAGWNAVSKSSILNLYWYPMSLNNIFWGYQQAAFYGQLEHNLPTNIKSLAQWFGLEYVLLRESPQEPKNTDPLLRYAESDWEEIPLEIGSKAEVRVKKLKTPEKLATLTKRPTILVIGRFDKRAYEQVFRALNGGILDYEKAMLVEGKDSGAIDDYSLAELKDFDLVFLYGYTYKNKERASKIIEDYVKQGGNLYIDTGWQFVSRDWQSHQTAEFFPIKELFWTNFGKSWELELKDKEIAGDLDTKLFAPPIWYGEPWGASTSKEENLRSWAKPIISVQGFPLIAAGSYGKGRVVWSGMNFLWHGTYYQNDAEKELLSKLIFWLIPVAWSDDITFLVKRFSPDKIEFSFDSATDQPVSLYWRETYFPDWRARLRQGFGGQAKVKTVNLPIYRAGPNFMLMRIPKIEAGSKVILELKTPLIVFVAKITSLFTFLSFFLFLWQKNFVKKILAPVKNLFVKLFNSIIEEEE